MKLIYKIAKAELRNLFYSPIAWFLTIAFIIECALTYTRLLDNYTTIQEMGGMGAAALTKITTSVFTSKFGLFAGVMQNLYLYIPLLTMGLISREINGGTISLLYSSPVKVREIVFGKYLSMMAYSFILLLVIVIFMVDGTFDIKSADYRMLMAATLGFYLLLCAYSAIGLFMSSLTSYQIVAAVSTFVMIGVLSYIGTLWQGVAFVRDLTYFLSLSGRTGRMLTGLIITKDVIYFIVIIYIFLGLTVFKLQSGRETKAWYIATGRYFATIISALIIGYIGSRPNLIGYWDTTANQNNTLTPNSQKIIKEFDNGKLEITSYSNLLESHYFFGMPEDRNQFLSRWEPYLRFKPDIEFHFVSYYAMPLNLSYDLFSSYKGKTIQQIADQRAKGSDLKLSDFETPEQIQKEINLKPELNRFVMKLSYNGKSTYLRVFNDMISWPGETEISAAFKRLLQAKMPKIAVVTGDNERSIVKKGDRDYKTLTTDKTFRYSLINQGFDVDTLSLNTQAIPDNITALVVADPQNELNAVAIHKIQTYIASGGNLLIAGEPGRQQIINPLLRTLGVQLTNGMLEQESKDNAPTLVLPTLTKAAISFSKMLDNRSIDTLPVSMNGVSGLSYQDTSEFHMQPLLITKAGAVRNTMARNPDMDMVSNKDGDTRSAGELQNVPGINSGGALRVMNVGNAKLQRFGAIKSEKQSPLESIRKTNATNTYTTALSLTRQINGKEQRIIISGDADFISNTELTRENNANFKFNTAVFSWLNYGQFPIDASRPDAKDNGLTISTGHVVFLTIVYVWVLPILILIFAAIFLIRRKRK